MGHTALDMPYSGLAAGPLGEFIPPGDPHAVSVSLPTWENTIGWASRNPIVVDKMLTGYPRFFIHRTIVELSDRIVERYRRMGNGTHAEAQTLNGPLETIWNAVLFPDRQAAGKCKAYLERMAVSEGRETPPLDLLVLGTSQPADLDNRASTSWDDFELHVVLYPAELFHLVRAFWQHTGFGISSRYAEICCENLDSLRSWSLEEMSHTVQPRQEASKNGNELTSASCDTQIKKTIRKRYGDLYASKESTVALDDVYLYPTGMAGLTHLVDAIQELDVFYGRRSMVAYGFLYVDTFKVISRIHTTPAILYGHCTTSEIDTLEAQLRDGHHISAIFIEVPGNPLLLSPDLLRLRRLADTYDFLVITDDTVGTPINVNVLPFSDVVWTSLTKMFSGGCNTMGGTVVLNSNGKHYTSLRERLQYNFHDTYHPSDAKIMELNSRDFPQRIHRANSNAEMTVSLLQSHPTVVQIYHPSVSPTKDLYDMLRHPEGGYSYLLSVRFQSQDIAVAFFDKLNVAKGPSLGTNFTLACPYTYFAHYNELEWARKYGVPEDLVRISVGVEEEEVLREKIVEALDVALQTAV